LFARRAAVALLLLTAACSSSTPHRAVATTTTTVAASATTTVAPSATTILDLTWISETHGWALIDTPTCSQPVCLSVLTTLDGGDTWRRVDQGAPLENVGQIRFANATVGYAFVPDLMMTIDGGVTWKSYAGSHVWALETNGHDVIRLSYDRDGCPGPCDWKIERGAVGSTEWKKVLTPTPKSQGVTARLVRQGHNDVYAAFMSNLAGGAEHDTDLLVSHDAGTTWTSRGEPCGRASAGAEFDTVAIAAAPNGVVGALCEESTSGDPRGAVAVSTDGGRTFGPRREVGKSFLGEVAITSPRDLVVASASVTGAGPVTYELLATHDGGRTWQTVASDPEEASDADHAWLGFESARVGRWVGGPGAIWTTTDGGDHWTPSHLS
jgi:photosystem II stability/assembly factor-like uncharacterized protein